MPFGLLLLQIKVKHAINKKHTNLAGESGHDDTAR